MPSFLVTERMAPELRARVLQSLQGDARARVGGSHRARTSRLVRLTLLLLFVICCAVLVITFRKSRAEFRASKSALSESWRDQSSAITPVLRARLRRIDEILLSSSSNYPGDLSAEDHRQSWDRLKAALHAPLVYVRGPIKDFERPSDRHRASEGAVADAFIRCFIQPPTGIKESALVHHLGDLYQPQAFRGQFVNLNATFHAVAFVDSSFSTRLGDASLMRELASLERELRDARLSDASAFIEAQTLFYVFDEPKTEGAAADFDGEAEHFVQVGAADLATGDRLLRLRRKVSPDWISEKGRLAYSRELDSCRLAFEIRTGLSAD